MLPRRILKKKLPLSSVGEYLQSVYLIGQSTKFHESVEKAWNAGQEDIDESAEDQDIVEVAVYILDKVLRVRKETKVSWVQDEVEFD